LRGGTYSLRGISDPITEQGINLHCGSLDGLGPRAVCRVACLEWCVRIGETRRRKSRPDDRSHCPLKYTLQKRLRSGVTVVENT